MNPRLIGGEMLLWSDLAGSTGPARGPALASLLAPFLGGRTLIAGPHDPAILTSTAGSVEPHSPAPLAGTLSETPATAVLPGGQPPGFPHGQPPGFAHGQPPVFAHGQPPGFTHGQPPGLPYGQPPGLPHGQPSGGAPTLLLRGVPDAEALADRFPVLCGGPGKLAEAGDQGWDTVVALDGLDRLGSAEDPEQTWAQTFEQLLAVLRPGGTLLLGLENLFGLHRLVAMPPTLTDADWTPAADYDETRPANLAAAQARLRAAGFILEQTYAAFPSPIEPAALVEAGLLTDRSHRGYVEALLNEACAPLDDTLTDPRRLAINAARHGQAAELAPGWILVAHRATPLPQATGPATITARDQRAAHVVHRGEATRRERSEPTQNSQPGAENQRHPADGSPAAPQPTTLTEPAPPPTRPAAPLTPPTAPPTPPAAPLTRPTAPPTRPGAPLTRPTAPPTRPTAPPTAPPTRPTALPTPPAPPSRTAEPLTRADLPAGDTLESLLLGAALRRDLPRLRALLTAWQVSPAADVPAAGVIVTDDGTHQILGTPGTRESALHAFAVTVLSGGFAHPWPAPANAADLTITLAAMAGAEVATEAIPAQTPRPSMVDLLAERDRLTRELAQAHAKNDFHERTVADRDRALVRERQINALLSTTKPARALLAGARVARRTIRRLRN